MAIKKNGKDIVLFYYGNKAISTIYQGTRVVWEGIRSCFGAGYWVSEKPWLSREAWTTKKQKNNN